MLPFEGGWRTPDDSWLETEAAKDGKMEVEAAVEEIKCLKPEEEYEARLERQEYVQEVAEGRTTNVDSEEENIL
jgi:hypothetical protein